MKYAIYHLTQSFYFSSEDNARVTEMGESSSSLINWENYLTSIRETGSRALPPPYPDIHARLASANFALVLRTRRYFCREEILGVFKTAELNMAAVKPQLRGLLASNFKKQLAITLILGFSVATSFKLFIANPKKQQYADFYKTYDADAAFRTMRNAGLLQSCGPE